MFQHVVCEEDLEVTLSDEGRVDDYFVKIVAEADCSYEPARLFGAPENCCPAESEMDANEFRIVGVLDVQGNEVTLTSALAKALIDAIDPERIIDKIWEKYHREKNDGRL